jgi:hypothetical protein
VTALILKGDIERDHVQWGRWRRCCDRCNLVEQGSSRRAPERPGRRAGAFASARSRAGARVGAGVTFRYVVLDAEKDAAEAWDVPFDLGATDAERAEIRALMNAGKPVEAKYGQPLFQYGAGMQGWQ